MQISNIFYAFKLFQAQQVTILGMLEAIWWLWELTMSIYLKWLITILTARSKKWWWTKIDRTMTAMCTWTCSGRFLCLFYLFIFVKTWNVFHFATVSKNVINMADFILIYCWNRLNCVICKYISLHNHLLDSKTEKVDFSHLLAKSHGSTRFQRPLHHTW